MRIGVLVFPGSNCDRDCYHVVNDLLGVPADYVWHRETSIAGYDAIIIPGGFSYGDYLRAGAVAKMSPVMDAVRRFAEQGGPVIGICNGFQILLECGLLPGAMLHNASLRFVCKPVHIRVVRETTAFSSAYLAGEVLNIPVANAEGNYFIDDPGLERLRDFDQIVFEYCDEEGHVSLHSNPNGSVANIAGICNRAGNVVGVMPHPERAAEALLGSTDGLGMFQSAVYFAAGGTGE